MNHDCLDSLINTIHFCNYLMIIGINLPGESGQLGINEDLFFRLGVKASGLIHRAEQSLSVVTHDMQRV